MSSSPEVKQPSDADSAAPDTEIRPGGRTVEEPGGDTEVERADPDAWPDPPPVRKRAITAGPGLEIITDGERATNRARDAGSVAPVTPDIGAESPSAATAEGRRLLVSHEADDDRGSRGPEQLTAAVAMLLGRVDPEAIDQHRVEYAVPLIWLWRRLVGAAYGFILISMTWFLVKLPSGLVSDARIPTQGQVAAAFHELRTDGFGGATLSAHVGISLFRLAVGLGVGAFLGVSVGLVAGAAPLIRTIVDPVSSFFRTIPGLAAGPLLVLWFGVGEAGLLSVVVFSVMWTVVAATADGRTEGLRTGTLDILDAGFTGARSALLLTWGTVLAIETVMAPTGLGPMIWSAQGQSDLMVAGIVVVGLVGLVLDTLLRTAHYLVAQSGVSLYAPSGAWPGSGQGDVLTDRGDDDRARETVAADPLNITGADHPQPFR